MLRAPQPRKTRAKKQVAQPEPTDTLIVVQALFTCWTKASRGGAAVVARSHLPQAFVLSLPQQPITQPSYMIQASRTILNSIPMSFSRVPGKEIQVRPIGEAFACDSIVVRLVDDVVHVGYQWNFSSGMPRRCSHPDILTLEKGQWGRVHYNQRQSTYHVVNCFDYNTWWYEDWVFNIGYFAEIDSRVFLDTQPHQRYTNMSKLW